MTRVPRAARRGLLSGLVVGLLAVCTAAPIGARASGHLTTTAASSLTLTAQNPAIVRPGGVLKLGLEVRSATPRAELGIQILVYPGVGPYDDFYKPPTGVPAYVLPASGVVGLSGAAGSSGSAASISIAVSNGAAAAGGAAATGTVPLVFSGCQSCDGVYPVQVVLVNRDEGNVELAELNTHLIYVSRASALPLRVGVVLPLGTTPALSTDHTALLPPRELADLGALVGSVRSHPGDRVSLDLYPQLEVGLAAATRSSVAKARQTSLANLIAHGAGARTLQLLQTPFIPLSVSALTKAGLAGELAQQFRRSSTLLASNFAGTAAAGPYVSTDALTPEALTELGREHINQLVLPSTDVTTTGNLVQTAPFALLPSTSATTRGAPMALAADPSLARYLEDPGSDPILAAHELLAALATIFFGSPFVAARGVAITPSSLPTNPATLRTLLDTLLGGLNANPILTTATVGQLFSNAPLAADTGNSAYNATIGVLNPGKHSSTVPGQQIKNARRALTIYSAIARGDTGHEIRLNDTVLLAEGSTLTEKQRNRFTGAVTGILPALSRSLSVSSSRTITLTARSGEFPITIKTAHAAPPGGLSLVLRLSSGQDALSFPHTKNHSLRVKITSLDSAQNIEVSSRTSGASALTLELVSPPSPAGQVVLLRSTDFSVRSTAISGVAIGLTLGAALVLLAWWLRSIVRQRRRGRHAAHGAHEHTDLEVAPRG